MTDRPSGSDFPSDRDPNGKSGALDRAATAIERGELVIYPTETVYGLGADALDPAAIERVFECKGRSRENPLSFAVCTVEEAFTYTRPTARERAFAREFLPGPLTIVVERCSAVPDALTAGRDCVGIRVPDHDLALALLERTGPLTATSANRSGGPNARRVADLDPRVRETATIVLDGGETLGGESTVVDVSAGAVLRHGAHADAVEQWLAER